ncbi:unnamed protein product [Wuchereria bancrofti]|uniref:Uncharacterized protein n=1 Tax=Wuchereria bancrofti TaxID=6293 RepID=A0A3P7DZR4_WUCBA|nr:unnamed protein product [Wuchereria bancrofti]
MEMRIHAQGEKLPVELPFTVSITRINTTTSTVVNGLQSCTIMSVSKDPSVVEYWTVHPGVFNWAIAEGQYHCKEGATHTRVRWSIRKLVMHVCVCN